MSLTLDTYRLLGRSGLRVSPLALGTATFGTDWGWAAGEDDARKLFDTYVERAELHRHRQCVRRFRCLAGSSSSATSAKGWSMATKYSTQRRPGDPNSGGAHRKNLFASVEASLGR